MSQEEDHLFFKHEGKVLLGILGFVTILLIIFIIYSSSLEPSKELRITNMNCLELQSYILGKNSIREWTDKQDFNIMVKDQYIGRCLK